MLQSLPPIPASAVAEILAELERKPITVNEYRKKVGSGRSQAFGLVNKRSDHPDISRQCWKRPYLYGLLEKFATTHVPFTDWDAVTVNQSFSCAPHKDKGNEGLSYIVAFGDFWRGKLTIHDHPDLSGSYDIKLKPLLFNGSALTHSVESFQGDRFSLVYYRLKRKDPAAPYPARSDYYAAIDPEKNDWKLYKRNLEGPPTVITGLPHPLKGRKKISVAKTDGTDPGTSNDLLPGVGTE
jgi:hypothetical protein